MLLPNKRMPNISNYIFEEHIKIHILEYLSRLHSNSNFMFYDGYMNMTKAMRIISN